MAKKDIGRILNTGSVRQRLLLIAEDIARSKFNPQDKLLTDHEFNQLSESFKKPNEIKLWREFRESNDTVVNAIVNLQGLKFELLTNYSNLRGYILMWNAIENAELLVNSVLHEIEDPQERRRIAENGAKGVRLLFSKIEPDQEGYLGISVDFEEDTYTDEDGNLIGLKKKPIKSKTHSLWYVMNNVKKEVETSIVRYLSWERAILDYMEERGFNVKTYKDEIKRITEDVYKPIIGWPKYSGEINLNGVDPPPRLEKVLRRYAICPNVEELKVDEAQYSWFKKHILEDE